MKRKIVTILLTLSMVLGSVLSPLEIKAKTEVSDRQSVEWNGNTCGYQVGLPEGYDPDGGMRYPVMYLLPDDGLGEYPEGMEDMLGETMSGEKGIDMILVKPAFTLDMDVRQVMELVAADVDAKYNTIPGAGNRAVVGTGAGGYLAYILGLTETKQADDQEPAEDAKDPEESADTKTGQEDLDKTAGEIPDTDSDTPQETLDSRDVEEALDAEKGSDAERSDAGDAEKESNANRSDVRDAEKETDVNRSDVQDNEKELDARQLEAGKESDAEQKPDASQAELQSPAKDSDADTLDLHYIDGNGEEIAKKRLSAGEKQLMVISLLWALAICSKKKLPVIIDTPLSRLDSAHREALIKTYFPNASEQTIILSTDSEIDERYYSMMKDSVGDEYTLNYCDRTRTTTIKPGYFGWKGDKNDNKADKVI